MTKKNFKMKLQETLEGKGATISTNSNGATIIFNNENDYNNFAQFIAQNYYSFSEGLVVSGSWYDNQKKIVLDYK